MNFGFQPKICNSCHELMQKSMSFHDVATAFVKENDFRNHFFIWVKMNSFMNSLYFFINLLRNAYLTEKRGTVSNTKICYHR